MGVIIKINVEDKRMKAVLSGVATRIVNLEPVFKDFGEHMVRSVAMNFQVGGRPTSWTPSKKSSGKTLIKSGRLSQVVYRASNQGVIIGTRPETNRYAAIHQFGGPQSPVTILPITAKALKIPVPFASAIGVSGKLLKSGRPFIFRKSVTIPAGAIPQRKFLLFQGEDIEYLKTKGRKYIVSGQL